MTDVLNLHSLAVLINYERTSGPISNPRFRHTKLREVASPEGHFNTLSDDLWSDVPMNRPKRGFIFDTIPPPPDHADKPDLPTNMLSSNPELSAARLSEQELETIFWEVRGHDGCYQSIAIFQEFADLYLPSQPLHVQLHDGTDFVTTLSTRVILEFTLQAPKQVTLSVVMPSKPVGSGRQAIVQSRYTGESSEMRHSAWGFGRPTEKNVSVVLDLASMQFGSAGRGRGGDFFILDTMDGWYDFVERIVLGCEPLRTSGRISQGKDSEMEQWFKDVAGRVKERWDARAVDHWCSLCGKPEATKRCGRCSQEYYCSEAHSRAAWKNWHKRWCKPKA